MSGEEVVFRKSKQPVLLKDKRRLREKRRSTGIGELDLDNLMINDELTASNTALNESPLLPICSANDLKFSEIKSTFVYPPIKSETSTELRRSFTTPSNLEYTSIQGSTSHSGKLSASKPSNSEIGHNSSSPPNPPKDENRTSSGIKCQHCSVTLEAFSALQKDYRQMKKNHDDELISMKMLLKAKHDEIGVLASKIDLLSDTLKLADESYTRLREENDILMKHFSCNPEK